jgi:hypothetical protein
MSTQYDYKNRMNKIDDDINKLFNNPQNNEISHQHKPSNDEKEEYIQKSCCTFP